MKGTSDSPSDFKEFIALYKETVYKKLCEYMPNSGLAEFDKMVRTYVDRKGQYRRPSYVLLWTQLYGGKIEDAILPAAVQQASEDYVLMHDDWMDGNTLRRGLPAAHLVMGPIYAILAGDTLHVELWRMAHDASNKLGGRTGKRYFDKFYDIMLITHIGQYRDIHLTYDIKDITKFTPEDYYRSIHAKSAYYTIYGPMQCGAIIAGAEDVEINRIAEYGVPAGNAFQIKDDILDCSSTEEVLGKTIGTDIRAGTKTIILWHAVQNASASTLEKLKNIYTMKPEEKKDSDIRFVIDTFKELDSINYAEKEAERLTKEALDKFEQVSKSIPESPVKQLARSGIGHTTGRKK